MELTQGSERSANYNLSPRKYPKEYIQYSNHGESLKSRKSNSLNKLLSFNRNQSRAVTGLLTGHNTLRRHLHLLGQQDSPLCRKCGIKEETSAHILCECEALATLRYRHLRSYFLEPEDIKSTSLGVI